MVQRPFARALACVLWVGAAAAAPLQGEKGTEAAILRLANAERARAAVPLLAPNPSLARAAQLHAEAMARVRRLEHDLPGTKYPKLKDRLKAVGYGWDRAAENISFGYTTPAAAVAGWMRSAGHRKNLLERAYTQTGVGFARDSAGKPYYVQVFARPD